MSPRDDGILDPCGCCEPDPGLPAVGNRPGLSAIRYRGAGTHPTVLSALRRRLHRWTLPDGDHAGERPLAALTTRAPDDPVMALLDGWAVVSDVLTFYQERIANEGFLRTATERRSVLELARSIGYELRPGVAASTWLAFRVEDAEGAPERAEVPAGTPVQSLPAADGERPQTFETSDALTARRDWNALRPRLTTLQGVSPESDRIVVEGTGLGIRGGDLLLVVTASGGTPRPVLSAVEDRGAGVTAVELEPSGLALGVAVSLPPEGVLDPDRPPLPLTRGNVREEVWDRRWDDAALQTFLQLNDWDEETVLSHLAELRAEALRPGAGVQVMRESLGVFGHNAPRQEMLAPPARRTDPWPLPWDGTSARTVWTTSQGGALSGADLYLEREVTGAAPGGWAVLEVPSGTSVTRIARRIEGVVQGSRSDYGMSGKATGLRFPDGSAKPDAFLTRSTTVRLKGERLTPAAHRIGGGVAAGTTTLTLDGMAPGLRKGQKVALSGQDPSAPGVERHEVVTLRRVVHQRGYTTLHFEETAGTAHTYLRESLEVNANVVRATHGETVAAEVLGSGDGAIPHPRFGLRKPPLTHVAAANPAGAESTLTVRVNGVEWEERASLYGAGSRERAYVVRIGDDGSATVQFGDGRSGARLPTGQENVVASYRTGIGMEGQVGAGSLTLLPRRPFGVREVTNPLAAAGAADPESLDDARENAPRTVRTLDRVVSLEDYEDFARGYAGIGKARATAVWDGRLERIHLTVAAADGSPVGDDLRDELVTAIEGARDPLRPLVVEPHQPFVFFLAAKVRRDRALLWEDVRAGVEGALHEAFSFRRRGFAEPVTAAEVLKVMHGVEGVVAVDLDELYRTPPSVPPSGPLFRTVLDARPARWDRVQQRILPAQLLLLHPLGVELSEMTP